MVTDTSRYPTILHCWYHAVPTVVPAVLGSLFATNSAIAAFLSSGLFLANLLTPNSSSAAWNSLIVMVLPPFLGITKVGPSNSDQS